jgi:hypothetical protein
MMSIDKLRYIVFLLDSTVDQHDGKVFCSIKDAREFCKDAIDDHYASKFIIGSFVLDGSSEMNIEFIESFGLKTSPRKKEQLNLFSKT